MEVQQLWHVQFPISLNTYGTLVLEGKKNDQQIDDTNGKDSFPLAFDDDMIQRCYVESEMRLKFKQLVAVHSTKQNWDWLLTNDTYPRSAA